MEHLLYGCEHYSAKIWDILGRLVTWAISHHTGDYIPNLVFALLEIVLNKPHPSILLQITTWKVLILLLQETKPDITFRHAQLQTPRRREELHPRIQAHLISVVNKIIALLEYQCVLQYSDSLSLLSRIIQVALHAHSEFILSHLLIDINAFTFSFSYPPPFCAVTGAKIPKK
jgi:hypothetical protein